LAQCTFGDDSHRFGLCTDRTAQPRQVQVPSELIPESGFKQTRIVIWDCGWAGQETYMSVEVLGMVGAGVAALVAGLILARARFRAASGAGRVVVLGPVFEATPLAVFAAEHFTAARDLMPIVPRWIPGPLFWTYFVGAALLAAAVSFIAWRHVHWSAALLFLIVVATIDLPNLPEHAP
jgi:hypothetical protein